MKKAFRTIRFVIVIVAFVLAGCSMDGETATIVLNLGQTAKAVSLGSVNHVIALSGPTGSRTVELGPGSGSVSISVASGTWTINVSGYFQGQLYSTGAATVNVVGGRTTDVSIQMTVVYVEPVIPAAKQPLSSVIVEAGMETPYTSPIVCSPGDTIRAYIETAGSLGTEDLTWTWKATSYYTSDVPIPANLISSNNEYIVDANDVHKTIWATGTHPNYSGDIRVIIRVCKKLDGNSDWTAFANGIALGNDPLYPANGYYVLANDITINDEIVGTASSSFQGYFDGNGKTIDLTITLEPPDGYAGLFAHIRGGEVANFILNAAISFSPAPLPSVEYAVGAVTGYNQGDIYNVSVTLQGSGINIANISMPFTAHSGGIAGRNIGYISNCNVAGSYVNATGNSSSKTFAGGIVGINRYGEIYYCWAETDATATGDALSGAGGIAGSCISPSSSVDGGIIENCVFLSGTIDGSTGNAGRIWGNDSGPEGTNNPGTGKANYGNAGTTMYESGYPFTVTGGTLTNKQGLDFPFTDASSEDWWKTTAGWANIWDGAYDYAWKWDGYRPTLWFN